MSDVSGSEILERVLDEPLNVQDDWGRVENLLLSAHAKMPDRLELLIALYKLYAYSNRNHEALILIDSVLHRAAEQAGFDADYRRLGEHSAAWADADGATRAYLYTLKAKGFVLLRQGTVERAHEVLSHLLRLDRRDTVGGSVVMLLAERVLNPDDNTVN